MKSKLILTVDTSQPMKHFWKMFAIDIHHKEPAIQRLVVHLPNEENVYFNDREDLSSVVENNVHTMVECKSNSRRSKVITLCRFSYKMGLEYQKKRMADETTRRIY